MDLEQRLRDIFGDVFYNEIEQEIALIRSGDADVESVLLIMAKYISDFECESDNECRICRINTLLKELGDR